MFILKQMGILYAVHIVPFQYLNSSRQCDEESSHKLMDRYAELGGNFIDTANLYSFGKSEEIIGTWLKK